MAESENSEMDEEHADHDEGEHEEHVDHDESVDEEHADNDESEHEERADNDESEPEERTVIRSGRNFEEEYRLDASEAGEFLIALGEQLRDDDELTIVADEWELPFAFGEPVELEIDYDGMGEPELEIELELPGRTDEEAPAVE